ncbi:MAG: helix-hairpin-helix domain-containing protein [Bacteroidaceae bacterium]|nr:helix-hairpin-helix domain-containing protein [Bacteroidaceae bacterium]
MKQALLTLIFILCAVGINAQSSLDWNDFVAEIFDEMDEDEESAQAVILELEELRHHPIDLNTATESELHQLPFLSDNQVKDILFYRERNGLFMSLGELMLIRSIDFSTRRRLQLFCTVAPVSSTTSFPTLRNLLRFSEHELTARTDIPFYVKDGYRSKPDSVLAKSPNKIYLGNNSDYSLRYSLTSMNRLYAGIQVEKDGGEKHLDYVSAYVQYKHNRGLVRNIIIGNYRVGFAQGLVINSNLSFGKLAMLGSSGSSNRGFTRHSSTMEANYFRGIALSVKPLRPLTVNAFFSYNDIDGTFRTDTVGYLSSLKTDGLHRTQLERSKRHNVSETTFGGNTSISIGRWAAALTAIHSHLSVPLMPVCSTPSTIYRRYNPSGTDFTNFSIAYGYGGATFSVQGETASTADGGIATLNAAQYRMNSTTNISLTQRYYSKDYTSLHARSFGENSSVQNESGVCLAVKCEPVPHVQVTAYADWFYFPWLKYQVSESSSGFDVLGQVQYQPSEQSTWQLRYRIKSKQKDVKVNEDKKELYYYTNQQVRLQNTLTVNPRLTLKSVASLSMAFKPTNGNAVGYGLSEQLRWKPSTETKRHIDLSIIYFHTDDYDSRIYGYEPSLLYTMGMASYAYHGIRASILLSTPVMPRLLNCLTLNAKLSATKYFNRDTIGTAQELIDRSHREDFQLQLRYTF